MSNKINIAVVAAFLTLVAAPQLAFAQASFGHHAAPYGTAEGGDYTPSMAAPAHGVNHDFQDGSRG
jgi:hypothetical protein